MSKTKYHITNIHYPFEKSWDKKKNFVYMHFEYIDVAIINAIRRNIISNVETIGIRTDTHNKSQIEIVRNDTPLHNQFLSHRIGMVPLNIPNPDKFNYEDYELIIDVENNSSYPKEVLSNDIQIRQISKDKILSETETRKIFPPDPITNEFILITILKPKYYDNKVNINLFNSSSNILKLYVKSKLYKSVGEDDSRFNPTCCCVYQNMVDEERVKVGLNEYLQKEKTNIIENNLTELSDEELINRFNTSLKDRYYYINEEGEPNKFIFKLESIGIIPPIVIVFRGIISLKNKIQTFISNLLKGNKEIIEIIVSNQLINCYNFLIKQEDDTLGNLLHNEIIKLFCQYNSANNLLKNVSYSRPHPLKKEIILSLQSIKKIESSELIKDIIVPACESILKLLNNLLHELENSPQLLSELKLINT